MRDCNYYLFPFHLVPPKSRVIIYGMGEIGKTYVEQIKAIDYCEIALLVDKDHERINRTSQYKVHSINSISEQRYNFLIIASDHYKDAIYSDLISINVDKNKIVMADTAIVRKVLDDMAAPADYQVLADRNDGTHINVKKTADYSLYVEDIKSYKEMCSRDYYIDKPADVCVVENGIIWPHENETAPINLNQKRERVNASGDLVKREGVYNAAGDLVAGSAINSRIDETEFHEAEYVNETVVYGGFLHNHYGHMLRDDLSRMWWFLENPEKHYKYVFVSKHNFIEFYEFFLLLGLRDEDIILLKKPTRFKAIIIPERSFSYDYDSGKFIFNDKAAKVFNFLRGRVESANYENIYLTRTKFNGDRINEEYFEDYYGSLGYRIISPEQLTVLEQIGIMAGAKKVVCTGGTLHHQILFCRDGIDITVLNGSKVINVAYFAINQLRKAKCTFIDVSMNFLPSFRSGIALLLMPTLYWKKYTEDQETCYYDVNQSDLNNHIRKYIEKWARALTMMKPIELKKHYSKFTLADVIIGINKYLLGNELDDVKKKMLFDVFNPQRYL